MPRALGFLTAVLGLSVGVSAHAAEAPAERQISAEEVQAWLDRPSGAPSSDSLTPGPDEAPPPPPRKHGFTVESGLGALSHLGPLSHVTPTSPWFHLQLGYEPLRWLMVFAETDLVFSNTSYAAQPPPPRTYRLFGFGGGLRGSLGLSERFGAFLEGSAGIASVSDDLLEIYGFLHATEWQPYIGGRLGLEWRPVNPHLCIGLSGGMRTYQSGLRRERSSSSALAVLGGLSLRYTF